MLALAGTAGVGEHTPDLRRRAAERPRFLGIAIDPAREDTTDAEIGTPDAPVRTFVITAPEDLEIAPGVPYGPRRLGRLFRPHPAGRRNSGKNGDMSGDGAGA